MAAPAVSVFVRVRPLTNSETKAGSEELPGLRLKTSEPNDGSATVMEADHVKIEGFAGVLGQEASNKDVFERCFAPRMGTVLQGGAASLFCYGYTGSGKTHTVIGYGKEKGLYYLAAERLLQDLRKIDQGLFLRATACELYNDEVFDLIGSTKLPCTLRVDESGQLQVLGPQESVALDQAESGIREDLSSNEVHSKRPFWLPQSGQLAAMVTQAASLRSVAVTQPENLEEIRTSCVQQRAAGSSTEHAQSSRSHAMMRMEVVNAEVLQAQAALESAKSLVPARKNALDNIQISIFDLLCDGHCHVLRKPTDVSASSSWGRLDSFEWLLSPEDYVVVEDIKSTYTENDLVTLRGYEQKGAKKAKDWATYFGVGDLTLQLLTKKKEFEEPGQWDSMAQALREKQSPLSKLHEDALLQVEKASQALQKVQDNGPACLGGQMLLVDLAGADYDHRSGQAQKESAAINKSLLSLKECFRALAKVSNAKPKFRDSKLTRILEDSLSPTLSSSRRNKDSVSVMLVNVSPAKQLGKMTLNSLRYGQMFATANGTNMPITAASRVESAKQRKPVAVKEATSKKCGPQLREELLKLYSEYCPEKTALEVNAIIDKFAGREAELLQKARDKYIGGA